MWIVAAVATSLAVALIAYACIGTYARKARVNGVLVPHGGEINIAAPVIGRVAELRVKEGDAVQAGDVLLVLDTDRVTAVAGSTEDMAAIVGEKIEAKRSALANERSLRETQARLRQQANGDRMLALDAELRKLEDELALARRRRDLAAQSVARYEELAKNNFVSPIQVQQQHEALLDQDSRLQALERTRLALQRDRATVAADQRQIVVQVATDLAAVDRELAGLGQEASENAARRSAAVVAPRAGVVTAVAIGAGQFVSVGQSLAAVMPAGAALEAHLYAPTRTVGFVVPGQAVLVRYAAYPYQKFGLYAGKVTAISQSAFAPSDLPPALQTLFGRQAVPEALYRVTVALDAQHVDAYGQRQPLKSGMALEADIVQDRRRIVEWMLEPLFAFAQRAS